MTRHRDSDPVVGDRVIHSFFRTRGTVLGVMGQHPKLRVIEFDNGDCQQLSLASIRLLVKDDLYPEERFRSGQEVRQWQSGRRGIVLGQYGDRVKFKPHDVHRHEICHAKHLFPVK